MIQLLHYGPFSGKTGRSPISCAPHIFLCFHEREIDQRTVRHVCLSSATGGHQTRSLPIWTAGQVSVCACQRCCTHRAEDACPLLAQLWASVVDVEPALGLCWMEWYVILYPDWTVDGCTLPWNIMTLLKNGMLFRWRFGSDYLCCISG